jgi:hypothetical protein
MATRARLALFLAGVFFGGGLDHLIFIASGSTRSHYGLIIGVAGQLGFAALDFSITAVLCWAHIRWSTNSVST